MTRAEPIILDVGGNIGQSIERYVRLFPAATIHSFEPFPPAYSTLTQKAGRHPNIWTHQMALADLRGSLPLHVNPRFSGSNSLLERPSLGRRYFPRDADLGAVTQVDVTTIDHFCTQHGIQQIDLVKIDVQGAELLVLKGASDLLGRAAISTIVCEVAFVPHYENGVLYHDLARYLNDFGYTLFDFDDHVRARNGQLRYCNALFLSRQTRRDILDALPEEP